MGKISVIIKRVGEKPYRTNISNTLRNLQNTVGGYIEVHDIASDMAIVCNEEGKLLGMPHNCNIAGINFFGDIIFVGTDRHKCDFVDLPIDFAGFKRIFRRLWEEEKQ